MWRDAWKIFCHSYSSENKWSLKEKYGHHDLSGLESTRKLVLFCLFMLKVFMLLLCWFYSSIDLLVSHGSDFFYAANNNSASFNKMSGIYWPSASAAEDLKDLVLSLCFSDCHLLYQINRDISWQLGLSPTRLHIELQEELAYMVNLVFLPLWQHLASCPSWNLSLDTKNTLWMFVEMLKVLWLLSCLHHHDPPALAAGAHGALQRSHSPGAVHLQCAFWLCLQNCPVSACSNINSNACLHRYSVYLIILRPIQSLQGWQWGTVPWLMFAQGQVHSSVESWCFSIPQGKI